MPFKSRKQERYLQINEPEIYRDWVEQYGHFKGAEAFSAELVEMAIHDLAVDRGQDVIPRDHEREHGEVPLHPLVDLERPGLRVLAGEEQDIRDYPAFLAVFSVEN